MKKKYVKGMFGLTTGSILLGTGASVLGTMNNDSSLAGQQALSNFSSFMPSMGSAYGSMMTLDMMRSMMPKKARKRR